MEYKHLLATAGLALILTSCGGGGSDTPSSPTGNTNDSDGDGIAQSIDNCPAVANAGQEDADVNGVGDACDSALPTTYVFESAFVEGESSVSYTGQTARQMLIDSINTLVNSYTSDQTVAASDIVANLNLFFLDEVSVDDTAVAISRDNVTFIPQATDTPVAGVQPNFGDISGGKDLVGKIAGNDTGMDSTELNMIDGLVNNDFFGWDEGSAFVASGAEGGRPDDFVQFLFNQLAIEVTDGVTPSIKVVDDGTGVTQVSLDTSTVDINGRDYAQLIQKFLLGSVTFSQGTSDYLQTDFSADNVQDGTNPYTSGAHDWDESFGYFGAARNYGDYTDDEAAGKPNDNTNDAFENGYNDANGDGYIDLRSEINLANSTNCSKRDRGSAGNTNPTDFSKQAFDAYLLGRAILSGAEKSAAAEGGQVSLTEAQAAALEAAGNTVAETWERCIAATVIHYINDVTSDILNYDLGTASYADLANFKNVAKHWSEMKGFALGLQFNAESPIHASAANTQSFRDVLEAMGTGPVLPDATQNGAVKSVNDYLTGLDAARTTLQNLYGFDAENVANW